MRRICSSVNANVSLGDPGQYKVEASSWDGDVYLTFLNTSLNAQLFLDASSTFGGVAVRLHPTYIGSFLVHALPQWREVEFEEHLNQPDERPSVERVFSFEKPMLFRGGGSVVWGEASQENGPAGHVEVSSFAGPARLTL